MTRLKIARSADYEEVINGSRFLGLVREISSEEDFAEFLNEQRTLHPDATHHCSAYRIGEVMRFNDDGEPGGTAGRPMLEVVLKRNIDLVAGIVIRYYGGKKLGAGGLVRAYSGVMAKTLDVAGTAEIIDMATAVITAPFPFGDVLLRHIQAHPTVEDTTVDYNEHGPVLTIVLPDRDVETLAADVIELTQGQGELNKL